MGKFLGWLGGIAAAVIGGWLVWYLTRPPATTTFEGMVINGTAEAPLANAIVTVEIAGTADSGSFHDFTDEHGSYRLDFTGLGKPSGVTVSVEAKGFLAVTPASIRTVGPDNRLDFVMMPQTPSPPTGLSAGGGGSGGGGSGTATAHVPAAALHVPVYVQKPAAQAAKILIKPKQ